jgi:hypothetical protein
VTLHPVHEIDLIAAKAAAGTEALTAENGSRGGVSTDDEEVRQRTESGESHRDGPCPGTPGAGGHPRDREKGTDDQMNPAPPVMDWRSALWSAELAVTACPGLPAEP